MLQRAGTAVFLCGNKTDSAGNPVMADGVLKEYEIARKMNRFVIPVGATGYAAEKIWQLVQADIDGHYPEGGVKTHLQTLGNVNKNPDQLVDAIVGILKHVTT
jgi:hypothetical protein